MPDLPAKPAGETLLEFPCDLDIKAMGLATSQFPDTVLELVKAHAPEVGKQSLRTRESSGGKYLSVTVTLRATSKDQMDRIYGALSAHRDVLTAL